ncbi:MAG: 4Fe-4S binding protein [Actinomycetota bacterium]
MDHRPRSARWIDREEALYILEREHDQGRVHTAWFKETAGGRFYVICNCCKCCCLGMKAFLTYGFKLMTSSGYVARVDQSTCRGCSDCSYSCPFGAITMGNTSSVDGEKCMGCGICVDRCNEGAMILRLDPTKPRPLDIEKLVSTVGDEV